MKKNSTCDICGKIREGDKNGYEYEENVDTFDEVIRDYWLCDRCGENKRAGW